MRKIIILVADNMELRSKVGESLAEKLGFACYDKNLVDITTEKTGIDKELIEKYDEHTYENQPLFSKKPHYVFMASSDNLSMKSEEYIFSMIAKTIMDVKEEGDCVILGHAASYTQKNFPGVIKLKIVRNDDSLNHTYEKYYNYYSGLSWRYNDCFDAIINVSGMSTEQAVEHIETFCEEVWK